MTDYAERSARAYHNGKLCEELIHDLLPELLPSDEADGELFGAPVEIKSCQEHTERSDWTRSRLGRFYIRDYQHDLLVKAGGRYILAVMDGGNIIHTRMVLAARLMPLFEGCKTLTWGTVFSALRVAC